MKAGIVGVGRLGGAIALAMARDGVADEIVLTDVVESLAWAQAEDIRHGLCGDRAPVVRSGSLEDLGGADVVALCAGVGRKPGMSRLDLLKVNAPIVAAVARDLVRIAPRASIVVLTNPLDVMTALVQRATGLPRDAVVGSGALLDSVRLRILIAERLKVRPSEVEAYVLGEHGDRAVIPWSRVRVQGSPATFDAAARTDLAEQLRTLAARVIAGKGWTSFGPGGCTSTLIRSLLAGAPSTVPASAVLAGEYGLRDVALGVPAVVGKGRLQRVESWDLPAEELASLRSAGKALAKSVAEAESAAKAKA